MTLSKQAPPEYSLYNNGNARNCCGGRERKSGFVAPFAPNTVTLAPAASGHIRHSRNREGLRGCYAAARPTTRNTARQDTTRNDTFTHNSRSELAAATLGSDSYAYDYDNIGNRKTAQELAEETTYTANALNQYTVINAFELTYDQDGNQTRIKTSTGIWLATYNALNRPVRFESADGTTVITADYDYMGRRVDKRVERNGNTTSHLRFLYRNYLQVAALDLTRPTLNAMWFITWDPTQDTATRPLAIQKDGTWYTYGWDLTKNICELYTSDGYIATAYTYTPYGSVSSSGYADQPLQWSSEYNDTELGLVYYNYRHYNPAVGRWMGRDYARESFGINLFVYTRNGPVVLYDYLGLQDSKCCKDGMRFSEVSDAAGRKCCLYELVTVVIRVEPHGNYLLGEVGHAWVETPNMAYGFYPDSWHFGFFGASKGIVKDEKGTQRVAHSGNSYEYTACPQSIEVLEKNMKESEQTPPKYSLYNNGEARNCCGWACMMLEESGFTAPFAPDTTLLKPVAPNQGEYGPGRTSKN